MIKVLLAKEREEVKNSAAREFYSFSCGHYQSPDWESWGDLLVCNEAWISPHEGFPMHAHSNTEIITVVIEGELSHVDTTGHKRKIGSNEVQLMSSGKGLLHSELNSGEKEVHLYQIWIRPKVFETEPSYQSKKFNFNKKWTEIVSLSNDKSLLINQDCKIFKGNFENNDEKKYPAKNDQLFWIQIIEGEINLNGSTLKTGDGAGIVNEEMLHFRAHEETKFILIEMNNPEKKQ